MALDVYVMPMWRFKAGDLTTGVQRQFADRATIVSPLGFLRLQNIKATLARRSAVRQVRAVVKEAEQSLGARLQWRDEGEVVFSQQAWWGFEQGNRILIALFSSENAFQDVVTPSCLESLASNGALFH